MKILLLHPDDHPLAGPWTGQRWNRVIDLARCGKHASERWATEFGCPVSGIDELREGFAEIRRVRQLLRQGFGNVVDSEGIDWWELLATLEHQSLEMLVVLRKFAEGLAPDAEIVVTRDCFEACALRVWLGDRVSLIPGGPVHPRKGIQHYAQRMWRLPVGEVAQILGDKYDTSYRLRRHLHRLTRRSAEPVILVPTSYVNMSRTGCGYARVFPNKKFLLVATRQSGRLSEVPVNVRQEWLASYADPHLSNEYQFLIEQWNALKTELAVSSELAAAFELGLLHDFPRKLSDGLAIRNAWRRVLKTELVEAVLCCDDFNPHTHIPLLLARKRNLPTLACHHGALDGRLLIKTNHADMILAKGRMEHDYLVRTCGLNDSEVEIGAPSLPKSHNAGRMRTGEWIVFFSEPYEMTRGRAEEVYRDVLPGMIELANRVGKKAVVKLHPSENLRERQSISRRVLSAKEHDAIMWLTGTLSADLLRRTWVGVTVQSSSVVECSLVGVPCFRCDWLDMGSYGYAEQFEQFGVGIGLKTPGDIANIPEKLSAHRSAPDVDSWWQEILPERFKELVESKTASAPMPAD